MSDKCFCHLNGYAVKDATARNDIKTHYNEMKAKFTELDEKDTELTDSITLLSEFVTPQMFGAVGDGVADDTEAIKNALAVDKPLYFPKGTYLITEALIIPAQKIITGTPKSLIVRYDNYTQTILDESVNSIFVINGTHIKITDICLSGSVENGVNGITFGSGASLFKFDKIRIGKCKRAFNVLTKGSCWMGEFTNIQCTSCEEAYYFYDTKSKTTLTFRNCWAENCGTAYKFQNLTYSSLTGCGADYISYNDETNPYNTRHGSKDTKNGVYHFYNCKEITMNGCGCEYSYGQGMVYANNSYLTLNNLTCYFLKSEIVVTDTTYKLGVLVTTGSEKCKIRINGAYIEGASFTHDGTYCVAFNYSTPVYGELTEVAIKSFGVIGSYTDRFYGGRGYNKYNCILEDKESNDLSLRNTVRVGNRIITKDLLLGDDTAKDTLILKFQPFSNYNANHLIRVTVIGENSNDVTPEIYEGLVTLAHTSTVKNPKFVFKTHETITLTPEGNNLKIKLPNTFTYVRVCFEILSKRTDLVLWEETEFVSSEV